MIKIKDATPSDLKQINEIMQLSKKHWKYDDEFLTKFISKFGITNEYIENHTTKLLYLDESLVGFFSFSINKENEFELDNFFLHPNFIGKGIGRKLWDACCQTAKELGQKEFILWSDPNAESFYLKMGCQKIGVRESPMMPNRYPPILKYKL